MRSAPSSASTSDMSISSGRIEMRFNAVGWDDDDDDDDDDDEVDENIA